MVSKRSCRGNLPELVVLARPRVGVGLYALRMCFWENDLRDLSAGKGAAEGDGRRAPARHLPQQAGAARPDPHSSASRQPGPRDAAPGRRAKARSGRPKGRRGSPTAMTCNPEVCRRIPRKCRGLIGGRLLRAGRRPLDDGVPEACEETLPAPRRGDAVPGRAGLRRRWRLPDKIDTLTGFWAVDEKPTGVTRTPTPWAVRRWG